MFMPWVAIIYIYISVNLEAQRVEKWLSRFDVFNYTAV